VKVIDRDPAAPARGLCDVFVCRDIVKQRKKLVEDIRDVDLVIPALEDDEGLQSLVEASASDKIPLAFDPGAYTITSSKKKSDDLFSRLGLFAPRPWPDCDLPVILKPIGSSGSEGVRRINSQEPLDLFLRENQSNLGQWVIQEYLEGPSYSLEVIGLDGKCVTLQPTALEMDAGFDCKRVLAPVELSAVLDREFREAATTLAKRLDLRGIMDIEVVSHGGHLKILEIDARLPSQTPTVVERSTGVNMLELLKEIFVDSRLPELPTMSGQRGVVYEHVQVSGDCLEVSGEHVMARAGALRMAGGFFGADMAVTDFSDSRCPWVATLMVTGPNPERAWEKRWEVIRAIMATCGLSRYEDSAPDDHSVLRGRPH
jgi:pyrrolysine biosynthesis protein PylC